MIEEYHTYNNNDFEVVVYRLHISPRGQVVDECVGDLDI